MKSIILTHGGCYQISGASEIVGQDFPEIIGCADVVRELLALNAIRTVPTMSLMDRIRRPFGNGLALPDERVKMGVGLGGRPTVEMGLGFLESNFFAQEQYQCREIRYSPRTWEGA